MFEDLVKSEEELRAIVGAPSERAVKKQLSALDRHCRDFIARAPFLLLATSDGAGRCDVSPKGDAPGFVRVLDDTHLVIPDRPGNKRVDGMRNLLSNPHLGMIFLVPGVGETLRVNGRGCVTRDPALLDSLTAMGKRPALAIGVEVEECFLHCAKAFRRSRLWDPAAWPALDGLASAAQMFFDQTKPTGITVEDLERQLYKGYTENLY